MRRSTRNKATRFVRRSSIYRISNVACIILLIAIGVLYKLAKPHALRNALNLQVLGSQLCSDSPSVHRTCTNCKFRHMSLEQCFIDVTYGNKKFDDKCSERLPECEHIVNNPQKKTFADIVDRSYVISFDPSPQLHRKLEKITGAVETFAAIRGIHVNGSKLTAGELGVHASMMAIFRDAIDKGYGAIAIFEDDALLKRDFDSKFSEMASAVSCSCFLQRNSGCPPGVLMLGATVTGNDATFNEWDLETLVKNRQCANYIHGSWGAFANIYNVDVLPTVLSWLEQFGLAFPFDAIYQALAAQGYIVRVAYPYLSMALMNRTSTVQSKKKQDKFASPEERAKWYYARNRWNLEEFSG